MVVSRRFYYPFRLQHPLSLGLYQNFGQTRLEGESPVDWVEGVVILVAVLIVVSVGSLNDWQSE